MSGQEVLNKEHLLVEMVAFQEHQQDTTCRGFHYVPLSSKNAACYVVAAFPIRPLTSVEVVVWGGAETILKQILSTPRQVSRGLINRGFKVLWGAHLWGSVVGSQKTGSHSTCGRKNPGKEPDGWEP